MYSLALSWGFPLNTHKKDWGRGTRNKSTPLCSGYLGDGGLQLFAQTDLKLGSSSSQPPNESSGAQTENLP
jgi:hypothetical protein